MTFKFQLKHFGLSLLICSLIFMIHACTEDPLFNQEKSELTVYFLSGDLAGEEFKLNTGDNPLNDLQFFPSKNSTRVYCQPLIDLQSNRLSSSSSINWAWEGIPSTGSFPVIFFNDPSENIAGNLDFSFTNGDFILCNIPKGALCNIDSYGITNEKVEGSLTFSGLTDFQYNGIRKQQQSSIRIEFKIIRTADGE